VQPIRIGIVGVGKIARDQHIPAIGASPAFTLAGIASRHGELAGVPNFRTIEELLNRIPDLDAVSICTPPQLHHEAAHLALSLGKHVLLEKPPCASVGQLERLARLADVAGRTLYQTWHSRHARSVAAATWVLRERRPRRVRVTWKEDVRRWHPGQGWIWQAGGFGVLDPGINALSILTEILPAPIFPKAARLYVPSNCEAPIAAELELACDDGVEIAATFDFRETGPQVWDIDVETDSGPVKLSGGGAVLTHAGEPVPAASGRISSVRQSLSGKGESVSGAGGVAADAGGALETEYESIYRRFAELIRAHRSDVDARPLRIVADIFLIAQRIAVEPFAD
jgi:D-galactose 1-dehydrogenase